MPCIHKQWQLHNHMLQYEEGSLIFTGQCRIQTLR